MVTPGGAWRTASSSARAALCADIMLPGYTRALSAQSAARALLEAVRQAPPGVTIVGARELRAIVDAKFPQAAPKATKIR